MRNTGEYIEDLIAERLRGKTGVRFASSWPVSRAERESSVRRIFAVVGRDGDAVALSEIADIDAAIKAMARDLEEDLKFLSPTHASDSEDGCRVAFLPTSGVTAFVDGRDIHNTKLDRYLIGIDYGMFAAAFMLADCLIYEGMETHPGAPPNDGTPLFESAVRLFVEGSMRPWMDSPRLSDDEETGSDLAALAGKVATQLLYFVVLHEVGHIVLGHADRPCSLLSVTAAGITARESDMLDPIVVRANELAADRHAVTLMLDLASDRRAAWANLTMPLMFMRWLHAVETVRGAPIDERYPSPHERAEQICALVRERLGPDEADCFTRVNDRWQVWSKNLSTWQRITMKTIEATLAIPSTHVQEVFGISTLPTGVWSESDGVRIEITGTRPRSGMTGVEILISIAIGIGTGIPAGVAANYIFARLTHGKFPLSAKGQRDSALTAQDVEKMIQRALTEAAPKSSDSSTPGS